MGKDFLDFVYLSQNQTLTLQPITFHSSKVFSEEEIKMVPKLELTRNILNNIVMDLTMELQKEFIEPDVKKINIEISTPKTWFQHFKKDNFPKWLLKNFLLNIEQKLFAIKFL